MRTRVCVTVRCPSVRLTVCRSVRLSVHTVAHCSKPADAGLLLQKISIDCCTAGVRRTNAGSATLSAYVVAERGLVKLMTEAVWSILRLTVWLITWKLAEWVRELAVLINRHQICHFLHRIGRIRYLALSLIATASYRESFFLVHLIIWFISYGIAPSSDIGNRVISNCEVCSILAAITCSCESVFG